MGSSRDDLANDSDRLAQRVGVPACAGRVRNRDRDRVALDLGRPARHVAEEIGSQGHVGGARDGERLAIVERFELGELLSSPR